MEGVDLHLIWAISTGRGERARGKYLLDMRALLLGGGEFAGIVLGGNFCWIAWHCVGD